MTSRASRVMPTNTMDVIIASGRAEHTIQKVQIASRAPVVPRATIPALNQELEINMSRFRVPGISEFSLLLAPVIGAGILLWAVVTGGPRIIRWYTIQKMASRNSRTGRGNLLVGPGGEGSR